MCRQSGPTLPPGKKKTFKKEKTEFKLLKISMNVVYFTVTAVMILSFATVSTCLNTRTHTHTHTHTGQHAHNRDKKAGLGLQ